MVKQQKTMAKSKGDSESFLVTFPTDWDIKNYAEKKRMFPSVQDFIRELVRRDLSGLEKEAQNTPPQPPTA